MDRLEDRKENLEAEKERQISSDSRHLETNSKKAESDEDKKIIDFKELPYVSAVSSEFWDRLCSSCFRPGNLQKCGYCHQTVYCSRICQRRDWSTGQHARECAVFAWLNDEKRASLLAEVKEFRALRLVARLLARRSVDDGLATVDDVVGFPSNAFMLNLWNLPKHGDLAHDDLYWRAVDVFQRVYRQSSSFYAKISDQQLLTASRYIPNCLVFVQDTIGALDSEVADLGAGLYLQVTRFAHSCDPDLTISFEGSVLRVKSLRAIPNSALLSELSFSWTTLTVPLCTKDRRQALRDKIGLGKGCVCRLCLDPDTDDIMRFSIAKECATCKEPLVVMFNPKEKNKAWCVKCEEAIDMTPSVFAEIQLFWTIYLARGPTGEQTIDQRSLAESLLIKGEKLLHPVRNVVLAKLRLDYTNVFLEKDMEAADSDFQRDAIVCQIFQLLLAACHTMDTYDCFKATKQRWITKIARLYAKTGDISNAEKWYKHVIADCSMLMSTSSTVVNALQREMKEKCNIGQQI